MTALWPGRGFAGSIAPNENLGDIWAADQQHCRDPAHGVPASAPGKTRARKSCEQALPRCQSIDTSGDGQPEADESYFGGVSEPLPAHSWDSSLDGNALGQTE
jgi:hypothetical protein